MGDNMFYNPTMVEFGDRDTTDSGQEGGIGSALAINTVYQAKADGNISFNTQMGNQGHVYIYSDGSNPPTTEIAHVHGDWGNGHIPCSKVIRKGDFWKLTYAGAGTIDLIFWTPLEVN